jgi:hypothetical protein
VTEGGALGAPARQRDWFRTERGRLAGELDAFGNLVKHAHHHGHAHDHGDGEGWSEHIEGACGEIAVAKLLGIFWDGSVNTWKANDLPGLGVRTRSRHDYDLIVRPSDDDHASWVLVTGRCPHYRVHGWITGAAAKRPEFLKNYGGRPAAYFVPASELRRMDQMQSTAASR